MTATSLSASGSAELSSRSMLRWLDRTRPSKNCSAPCTASSSGSRSCSRLAAMVSEELPSASASTTSDVILPWRVHVALLALNSTAICGRTWRAITRKTNPSGRTTYS
jgi:hypothetical protein